MTNTDQATPQAAEQAWLRSLAGNRAGAAYVLFTLTVVFAMIPMLLAYRHGWEYFGVCLWGGVMALIVLGGGIWLQVQQPAPGTELDTTRMQVLALGGLAGLATSLVLGIGLAWKWWDTIAGGWNVWQGPDGWRVWITILAFTGGLFVMFLALQLARADERSNASLRRLLYGYNAFLTGLLVLGILVGLNLLAYANEATKRDYRWAAMSIYSLSPKSEKILETLDKPTKIYVLLPTNDEAYYPLRALLDNCRYVNSKLEVEYLSPDQQPERASELAKEYKFAERAGVLLIYGDEHRFIRSDELRGAPDFSDPNKATIFKGESVLMTELTYLGEGKEKPLIYFTQGNGELDLADARPTDRIDIGLGRLKQRLESGHYQVKGLQLSPLEGVESKNPNLVVAQEVPKDCSVLVIARPTQRWTDDALKALRNYMGRNGKLIVLMDVVLTPEKTMAQTGLEPFLVEYGVNLGNNRLLRFTRNDTPMRVVVIANEKATNPIAAAFARKDVPGFAMYLGRTVEPAKTREGAARFSAEVLFEAPPQQNVWAETDLAADPFQQGANATQAQKKVSREALPVAVAVTEDIPGAGGGPHAFMNADKKPRLVVFGDASFASNVFMGEQMAGIFYDLFSSSLAWLRERPAGIGIEPKKADVFMLNPGVNIDRMVLLPGLLVFVGIIGLGAGVWTVRRR